MEVLKGVLISIPQERPLINCGYLDASRGNCWEAGDGGWTNSARSAWGVWDDPEVVGSWIHCSNPGWPPPAAEPSQHLPISHLSLQSAEMWLPLTTCSTLGLASLRAKFLSALQLELDTVSKEIRASFHSWAGEPPAPAQSHTSTLCWVPFPHSRKWALKHLSNTC